MTTIRETYLALQAENPGARPAFLLKLTRLMTTRDQDWVRRPTIGGTLAGIERSVDYWLNCDPSGFLTHNPTE